MDEDGEAGKDIFQNEPRLSDASQQAQSQSQSQSQSQQNQPMFDTSRNGKREREATDPVTHLPVMIHDFTSQELKHALKNIPPASSQQLPGNDVGEKPKNNTQDTTTGGKEPHAGKEKFFAASHGSTKLQLVKTFRFAVNIGIGVILSVLALMLLFVQLSDTNKEVSTSDKAVQKPRAGAVLAIFTLGAVVLGSGVWYLRLWVENKIDDFWEDQASGVETQSETTEQVDAESTQWLNSVLAAAWPLVNPGLFASLADTLEDFLQANLPKVVNMISVEDLGQGSEALRVLGIRWLPSDTTPRPVSSSSNSQGSSTGYEERNSQQQDQNPGEREQEQNHMKIVEAEEGDSVSLEVAFAYRARPAGKSLSTKAKNAHLFLAIYLPAGIRLPIWVEIQGIVGMLRLRLQLTPDPPFLAQSTFTFMGKPKVKLSCMPMFKHGLNIMNVPIISNFVQTSVDAAMADYVAPKNLTLDLKDMIMADDFKKDASAHGVIVVRIESAVGFKEGDTGMLTRKKGSADPYVSLSWTKFGKSVWATRVIASEMEPVWDETGFIIVGPKELNAQERLRVQLWDSHQPTADGDLGFIDIGLKEIMQDPSTYGKMLDRRDKLHMLSTKGDTSCILNWSVGYFPKTRISTTQLAPQSDGRAPKNVDDFKNEVAEGAEKKLREARKDKTHEIEQQKAQELKAREDEIVISSPPPPDYPSGIIAIEIHQILGLGYKQAKRRQGDDVCEDDDQVEGDDLLSSYCTIILNHQRVFKTRTKPKSAKPSFNVGAERFIRNWPTTEVILSVRDLRAHERDPLVGIVVLPLAEIFKQRSQIDDYFSLAGGIGHGRVRISMVFRSVQLQAPRELLGWEYGTLQIKSDIKSNDLPDHYKELGLKLRTSVQSDGMSVYLDGWSGHQGHPVDLAVRQRYCSSLVVEFQERSHIHHHSPAFAILWLKDIPDDEEKVVTLPVWKGDLKRAEANCELENGEKLGHIEVPIRFWPGTTAHHKKLVHKDKNLEDVMEVLDAANDNKVKVALEEAAFQGQQNIRNHDEGLEHDWPQLDSKEHEGKRHRTARKFRQWKNSHTSQ